MFSNGILQMQMQVKSSQMAALRIRRNLSERKALTIPRTTTVLKNRKYLNEVKQKVKRQSYNTGCAKIRTPISGDRYDSYELCLSPEIYIDYIEG